MPPKDQSTPEGRAAGVVTFGYLESWSEKRARSPKNWAAYLADVAPFFEGSSCDPGKTRFVHGMQGFREPSISRANLDARSDLRS
jgi:hypothetical protein